MTTIAQVGVRFVADPQSLVASAREQGALAGTAAGESFGTAFNEAGKKLIAGFIGAEAILKTVDFVRGSVDIAREAEAAWSRLGTTLRANVAGWDGNTDAMKRQIEAAGQLGFKESEVLASLIPLVGASKNVAEAMRVQNIAMDLARYTHKSLQEATDTLTKFEGGRFRGLAALGIQIDKHATKEQALAAVEAIAHGQRESFAATDEGAQKRFDVAIEKLQLDIGTHLLPALTSLANFGTTTLIPALSAVIDVLDKFAPILEGLAAALSVKVVGGFLAARVAALGFAGGVTTAAEVSVADGAVIEGTARGAAGAWRAAIGVILVLPEVMHLVGDAYESVRKTIFGANPIIDRWNQLARGSTDGSRDQTDALNVLTGAQDKLNIAIGDGTTATGKNALTVAALQDEVNRLVDAGLLRAQTAFVHTQSSAGGARDAIERMAASLDDANGSAAGAGNSALVAAGKFLTLAAAAAAWRAAAVGSGKVKTAQDARESGLGGPYASNLFGSGGMNTADYYLTQLDTPGYTPPTGGGGRHHTGGAGSSAAANAETKALHDAIVKAYEADQVAGRKAFDALHALHNKQLSDIHELNRQKLDGDHTATVAAIANAHRVASEQIAEARRAIDAQLTDRLRLNAEPVTAAEKAQQAIEEQRRLRDLNEQLAADTASGNVQGIRSGQEALQSLAAQQNIAALREQQVQADEQAKKEADDAKAHLDAQQKMLDQVNADQLKAEDVAYQGRLKDEDARYKLAQHDEDVRAERQRKKFDEHITAMEASKKATVGLAEAETKRFLQEQIKLAKEALAEKTGTQRDVDNAVKDLADFMKSLAHHEQGGWVGLHGPELAVVGEKGPERIFTAAESRTGLTAPEWRASAVVAAGPTGAAGKVDRSITVTVHNPAPEPASTSTRQQLQWLAATGVLNA